LTMAVDENTRMFEPPAAQAAEHKRDRAYLVVLAGSAVGEMFKIEQERTVTSLQAQIEDMRKLGP